jgi:hypothetical protein
VSVGREADVSTLVDFNVEYCAGEGLACEEFAACDVPYREKLLNDLDVGVCFFLVQEPLPSKRYIRVGGNSEEDFATVGIRESGQGARQLCGGDFLRLHIAELALGPFKHQGSPIWRKR